MRGISVRGISVRETERARRVPFGELPRAEDDPGVRVREVDVRAERRATVEYGFDDSGGPLRTPEGEAFLLPTAAPPGGGARRGRNHPNGPARLALIDDARER